MLLPVLLLLAQVNSKPPAPEAATKVALKVGETVLVKKMSRVKCDVPAIVKTELVDGRYVVKGLAEGTTACTFQGADATKVIEYTVAK